MGEGAPLNQDSLRELMTKTESSNIESLSVEGEETNSLSWSWLMPEILGPNSI